MSALVDVLAHLDDPRITEPAAALLARAAAAGVTDVVHVGTDPLADDDVAEAAGGARLWRAHGVHPMAAGARLDEKLARLEERLDEPRVVALGECGVDQRDGMPPLDVQLRALRAQLALARARGLPVILHIVHATEVALDVLRDAGPLPGGLWHGFSGAPEVAARAVRELDLHVSFGGQAANPRAKRAQKSAAAVPAERLLLESDTPDHFPGPPQEGRLSEPAHLLRTLAAVAALRGVPADALGATTAHNARRLLGLPVAEPE